MRKSYLNHQRTISATLIAASHFLFSGNDWERVQPGTPYAF